MIDEKETMTLNSQFMPIGSYIKAVGEPRKITANIIQLIAELPELAQTYNWEGYYLNEKLLVELGFEKKGFALENYFQLEISKEVVLETELILGEGWEVRVRTNGINSMMPIPIRTVVFFHELEAIYLQFSGKLFKRKSGLKEILGIKE